MTHNLKEFKSEQTMEEVKTAILKLKHQKDEIKRLLLVQVRSSIQEAFYNLPVEKQTLEDYVSCLRRRDTFIEDSHHATTLNNGLARNRDNRRSNKRKLNMKEPTQQNTYNKNKKMVITTIVVKISVGEAKLF
ncbi:hypothetical protein H8356DRAFT_1344525 [Neocallimastix lanati (nom. inval.)]|nr:hypothetical protein H8356DRAFT_1344525 [Neocallimastix sp. JGI-2020a]